MSILIEKRDSGVHISDGSVRNGKLLQVIQIDSDKYSRILEWFVISDIKAWWGRVAINKNYYKGRLVFLYNNKDDKMQQTITWASDILVVMTNWEMWK